MHSKTIIWIAFAAWCLICWRWYVCGVKAQCEPAVAAATVQTTPTDPEPDTMALQPALEPANYGANSDAARQTELYENDVNSVQIVELEDRVEIYFPYNSVHKEENAAIADYLNRLAQTLRSSSSKVNIAGHTDGIADASYNRTLSLLRAKNIRRILINKGVNADQISINAYGESKRIATDDTPAGRYKNRRVVIRLQ